MKDWFLISFIVCLTAGANYMLAQAGGYLNGQAIRSLAIDPITPTTVYARGEGRYGGVFKSTDGGASWTTANTGLTD